MIAAFRRLETDFKILVGALVALTVLIAIGVLITPETPPLSVRNDGPYGAMALRLWVERSGFNVREVLTLDELDSVDALFILEPYTLRDETDAYTLQTWVSEGNTLVIAGSPFGINNLLTPYDVALHYLFSSPGTLQPAAPTLLNPAFNAFHAEAFAHIETERADVAYHVYGDDRPVLASLNEGDGHVWIFGGLRPFTNRGIHDPGSARLIANIMASIPPDAVIGFDEGIHGLGTPGGNSFNAWLFGTSPGLGVLLIFGLTLLWLALRGRRFGRPIPLPDDRLRRESVEYIVAMATLFRRSGQRTEMLKHYEHQLRRRLSERYAIDPHLDAIEMVKAVVYRDSTVDETALRDLFKNLARKKLSEADLVKTVADLDAFLKTL